jgi:hypothetical protein
MTKVACEMIRLEVSLPDQLVGPCTPSRHIQRFRMPPHPATSTPPSAVPSRPLSAQHEAQSPCLLAASPAFEAHAHRRACSWEWCTRLRAEARGSLDLIEGGHPLDEVWHLCFFFSQSAFGHYENGQVSRANYDANHESLTFPRLGDLVSRYS